MAEQTRLSSPDLEMERPPVLSAGPLAWVRANLFNSWFNAILTLLIAWLLVQAIPPLLQWLFIDAVWGAAPPSACRQPGAGACWAFIHEKYRLILFGLYPYEQQGRPLLAVVLLMALLVASSNRRFWGRWLAIAWVAVIAAIGILMWGGVFGLTYVPTANWGGLPLTLGLATVGLVVSFPLGIVLALGRRSNLPALRAIGIGYIELIRGVPLITVLVMASVLFPLFLPTGVTIDKLLRTQLAFILFSAAYLAEVVRGGLQAIPKGQYEAADSLGLGYWQKTRLIILPQALRLTIPPMVNSFISFFKDTSLVIIIGLYDLLSATKAALNDRAWTGYYLEGYIFAGLIYFIFCFSMSKYSQHLERTTHTGHARR